MNGLHWNPVYKALERRLSGGDSLRIIIVPFIKIDALKKLLSFAKLSPDLRVIARWRPEDISSNVSDIEVYSFLTNLGIPLYINAGIHLKLYVFESNCCFTSSANLTLRGLGYSDASNIEVGNDVLLGVEDWPKVFSVIDSSTRVDAALYSSFAEWKQRCVPKEESIPFVFPARHKKQFSLSSLPATRDPEELKSVYYGGLKNQSPETIRRVAHDLFILGVPQGVEENQFLEAVREGFTKSPLVLAFKQFIRENSTVRFGEATSWLHAMCEDVPLPYRWEVKVSVNVLYNWMATFFPQISWSIPGAYSQVIVWKD